MKKYLLALLIAASVAGYAVPTFAAGEGENIPPADPVTVAPPPCSDRAELKELLAPRRWEVRRPMAGHPAPCPGLERYADKLRVRFNRWQTYRHLTPYTGCSGGGKWLRYTAIPGSVVFRESRCSWGAWNPSGACGPYQFIGWTSCDTSSFADKMRHHRTARYVLAVQGPSAWAAW